MIPKSVENPANKSAKATVKNDDGYVRSYEDDVEMPSLTFRSVVLGLAACTFSSAITAVTIFRQSGLLNLTGPMVQIMSYIVGTLWARLLPCVERGTNKMLGGDSKWQRMVHFVNPGPFTIKEHAVVSIIASCTVTDEFAPIAIHKASLLPSLSQVILEIKSTKHTTDVLCGLKSFNHGRRHLLHACRHTARPRSGRYLQPYSGGLAVSSVVRALDDGQFHADAAFRLKGIETISTILVHPAFRLLL